MGLVGRLQLERESGRVTIGAELEHHPSSLISLIHCSTGPCTGLMLFYDFYQRGYSALPQTGLSVLGRGTTLVPFRVNWSNGPGFWSGPWGWRFFSAVMVSVNDSSDAFRRSAISLPDRGDTENLGSGQTFQSRLQ